MFSKQLLHSSIVRFSLIAMVMCGIMLLGGRSTGQAKAASPQIEQSTVTSSESVPNALSNLKTVECNIETVGVDPGRIVTHCTPFDGAVGWYALPTDSDPKYASRVLAVLLTSKATNKFVSITYDIDNPTPCPDPNVCRRIWSVESK